MPRPPRRRRPADLERPARAARGAGGFERSRDYVQSLARGLAVLRSAGGPDEPATLAEIAAGAGLSRAAARRLVLTLEHLGYLRAAGRGFALAPRVLELGYGYLGGLGLTDIAQPFMERLSSRVGESCSMAVLDGQQIIYVARVPVRKVMTVSLAVGAHLPAYCTSMGRVLLAGLGPEEFDRWLAACRPVRLTPRTVTDKARLRRIVDGVRRRGHAWVQQELEAGLCSLAVPVRDRRAAVIAAINIGMAYHPGARGRAQRELLPALVEAARAIGRSLPPGPAAPART